MSFKNMYLNQANFDEVLKSCPNFVDFKKNEKKQLVQYNININGKIALLNVYFNKSGTTTITPTGKEQELGENIANYLKDNLTITNISQASFSIRNISNEDFLLLKEYLNDCQITEELINKINGEKIKFTSKYKDTMTITRYNNGNTQFQGKPLHVFLEIRNFLIDILDIKDIIDIENEVYKVNINVDDIQEELNLILSKSNSFLCATTKKMLSSALTLKKLNIELEDYSSFAFPALRAIEAYMKKTMTETGIIFEGNNFNQFDKSSGKYYLKQEYKEQVDCSKTINGIEQCYNYYNANRHTLFHTAGISSTTRILANKNDAICIIENIFKLIEETYNERVSS